MKRPDPLLPLYDFSSAPEPVKLLQEKDMEASIDDDSVAGTAVLLMRFTPTPCLRFRAYFHASSNINPLVWSMARPDVSSFLFDGKKVEGFCGSRRENTDTLEFDWHTNFEPVELCDMRPKTSIEAIFHLFNFPDFHGSQHQDTAPAGCPLMVLESDEWRFSIQALPDGATYRTSKRIKEEGGSFLTHVVKLERKDGRPFSGEDASEQNHLLTNFLTFTKGGKCSPVCGVGFDPNGEKTWKTFASPSISAPPYSWFNPTRANQAEILFPLFSKRWRQSEEWSDCLRAAIYWYAQANTNGSTLNIDAAIILAQSALERLAHHHLVIDKQMISPAGFDQLKASDRLRLLFSSLNIPAALSASTPQIQKVSSAVKWVDAAHAMTDIRNELVHPVSRKQVGDCVIDAWKLSLWYIEMSVLALCGYDDTYTSRLTAKYVTDSMRVPWGLEA